MPQDRRGTFAPLRRSITPVGPIPGAVQPPGNAMLKTTTVFAALLIALGVGAFITSSSPTALLPAYVGAVLLALSGLSSLFAAASKPLTTVAMVVALLGALAPAAALLNRASQMSALALTVNVGMLALCAALFILHIRWYLQSRPAAA